MNKNIYKSAIDHIKFKENLEEITIEYLSRKEAENTIRNKGNKGKTYKKLIYTTVLLASIYILAIGIGKNKDRPDFQLQLSQGNISAKYIDKAPNFSISADLVWLTEEELFHKYKLDILKGEVEEIKNIQINYNGSIDYRAIAWIKVGKVYRGDLTVGETISVLLPAPVRVDGLWVEDTEVMSNLKVGMTGIFMPLKYDNKSYREENGARLYLKDLADYGFMDGERYMFLDTDKGLVFYRYSYESIKSASNLEEVEEYVENMLK